MSDRDLKEESEEFLNIDPHNLEPNLRCMSALPPFLEYVQNHIITDLIRKHMQAAQKAQKPGKNPEIQIESIGISCYAQALSDIMECLSELNWDLKSPIQEGSKREQQMKFFEALKQAWLEMKFNTFGQERAN